MLRGTGQSTRGPEAAVLGGHGGQVARAVSERPLGSTVRRTAAGNATHGERRTSRASRDPDAGDYTARRNALVYAWPGQGHRTEPHDDQPDLARLRLTTASRRYVQAIAGPAVDRQGSRHRRL